MIENNNIQNDQHIEEQQSDETISQKELIIILKNHMRWLQSKGKEGERADLTDENPFIKIHNHHNYREEILDSKVCGCFYCLEIFSPDEIFQWHGEDENGIEQVAICPRCNINSVLGSGSGYPIEQTFLSIMRDFFFSPSGICLNQSKKVRKKLP